MKKWTVLCVSAVLTSTAIVRADSMLAQTPAPKPAIAPVEAPADGKKIATVLKERVNLRARPDTKAEVITQVNKGAKLDVLEEKDKWVRVSLPDTTKCYVAAKFVKDGAATSDAVNVRSGPSTNHKDIGKLNKGDKVEVVETKGEWTQIKPTAGCCGWVSADLVEVTTIAPPAPEPAPVAPPVAVVEPAPAPEPVVKIVEKEVLVQYVVKDGYLKAVADDKAPAPYELMTENKGGLEYRMAYLQITEKNMARYLGRHVRVLGNQRWTKGDRFPLIVVERIDVVL